MKTSTKVLIILTIVLFIPNIFLIRYLTSAIIATSDGFIFNFSTLSYVALGFLIAFLISFIALYIVFLKSLSLSNQLFFSIFPLSIIYGLFIVYISQINTLEDLTSQSVRTTLNIEAGEGYNSLLWVLIATILYLVLLFILIIFSCRPLKNVEKITQKLGDGRVKFDDFRVGGNKQFQEIEHSLNKINYIYKEKDNKIRVANLEAQKYLPKQILKFLGKNNIKELELGNQIQKKASILFCDLKSKDAKSLTLEENFNYINSYFKVVAPLIKRFDGFIDKYLGEGILAVFANPESAIECSHAILKALDSRNKNHKSKFESRICLHTGVFIFGIVGDEERKTPTIMTDILSLMGKMQEINDYIGTRFLISKPSLDDLPQKFDFNYRCTGCLSLEKEKLQLFESLEYYQKSKKEKLIKLKNKFENGVRFYNEGKYKEAKECFEFVLHYVKDDNPSYVYFNKANEKLTEIA